MASTAERLASYQGPAIFSFGFRPFFLGGAIWAALTMTLFVGMLWGPATLPTSMSAIDWHAHELLYGFLPAIVAGFLLTAVPNWTGRLPVAGFPLAMLVLVWIAGRGAITTSALIGEVSAAVIDLAFLISLMAIIGREIIAGRNIRNLKVLLLVGTLAIGNAVFHYEILTQGYAEIGKRVGIGAAVLLIILIGGRIIPSFTRNWLVKEKPGALPVALNRFDLASIGLALLAIALWIVLPAHSVTAAIAALAGAVHCIRLVRWRGWRTLAEPLVTILHVGYAFIPLGFLALSLSIIAPGVILGSAALHGWTTGAIGLMTLAVMTRASLGHTGQTLTASPAILGIYLAAGLAALARLAAGFEAESDLLLKFAALSWIAAFGGFAILFAPRLCRARS